MYQNEELGNLFSSIFTNATPIRPHTTPKMFNGQHPSTLIKGCNIFFEEYILKFGTREDKAKVKRSNSFSCDYFIEKYCRGFFFNLVVFCSPYHLPWQKIFIQLFLRWEGTNNTGLDFLMDAGITSSRPTFYKFKKILLVQEVSRTRDIISDESVKVFWFDNYNVNYYLTTQPTQHSSQIGYNGSGFGVTFIPETVIQRTTNCESITAKFLNDDSPFVENLADSFLTESVPRGRYFNKSPSYVANMFNTPMKPKLISVDYSIMKYFRPIEIKGFNPSDDVGLLSAMDYLDTNICANYRGRILVKCDLNIMYRCCKVCGHILYVSS